MWVKAFVAQEALDYHCPKAFFDDLSQYGCISGMVGSLIYYTDTHAFYDHYYNEIEEIRREIIEQQGMPMHINGDLKNALAWMAFEHVALRIYLGS